MLTIICCIFEYLNGKDRKITSYMHTIHGYIHQLIGKNNWYVQEIVISPPHCYSNIPLQDACSKEKNNHLYSRYLNSLIQSKCKICEHFVFILKNGKLKSIMYIYVIYIWWAKKNFNDILGVTSMSVTMKTLFLPHSLNREGVSG